MLKKETNCDNAIVEIGEKFFCGNGIAENGREKKIVVVEIWGGIKKKNVTFIIFLQQITSN